MTGSQSGKPLRVANAFAKIISGTVPVVAASSTPLRATSETIYEVLVQNSSGSANTVLVGSMHRQDLERS